MTFWVPLIFSRLQEETAKVEEHLLSNQSFSSAIVDCFLNSKADSFENLLEPLQKLLRLSPPVASSLAHPDLFSRTVQKLQSKKALVRLNLLRIIRSICDASDEDGALISTYGLDSAIADLAKHDQAILVREMAGDLLKSSELNARRSLDGARRVLRRSSSSTMTPTLPSNGSLPPTPSSDRAGGRAGSYFDLTDLARSLRPIAASSPYRPVSRESELGGSSTPTFSNGGMPGVQKSRLPRTRPATRGGDRVGAAGTRNGEQPSPAENPSALASRNQSAAGPSRRRRMTSQG